MEKKDASYLFNEYYKIINSSESKVSYSEKLKKKLLLHLDFIPFNDFKFRATRGLIIYRYKSPKNAEKLFDNEAYVKLNNYFNATIGLSVVGILPDFNIFYM